MLTYNDIQTRGAVRTKSFVFADHATTFNAICPGPCRIVFVAVSNVATATNTILDLYDMLAVDFANWEIRIRSAAAVSEYREHTWGPGGLPFATGLSIQANTMSLGKSFTVGYVEE